MGGSQHTLAEVVRIEGIGLHTGSPVSVILRPAPIGTGVVFTRGDGSSGKSVRAHVDHVVDTRLATSIGNSSWRVSTIEHLLATLQGLEIDNIYIEVEGDELPILDGSARLWIEAIDQAGRLSQESPRHRMEMTATVEVRDGDRWVRLRPGREFSISAAIDFEHPSVGRQALSLQVNPETFRQEIGWARTFGFLANVEGLRRLGLVQGGSLENAVVFGPDGVMNPSGLRAKDEPIRHKILDMIGDLSLLGRPIVGALEAEQPGHSLTRKLVCEVIANPACWKVVPSER